MHTCRRCGTPNRPGRNHCIACGEPLSDLLDDDARSQGHTLPGPGVPASEVESRLENEPRSERPNDDPNDGPEDASDDAPRGPEQSAPGDSAGAERPQRAVPPPDAAQPRGLPPSLRGRTLLGIAPGAPGPASPPPSANPASKPSPPAATDPVAAAPSEQLDPANSNQEGTAGTPPSTAPTAAAPASAAPASAPRAPSEPLDQDTLQSNEAAPGPPKPASDEPKPLAPTEQFKAQPAATEQLQAQPAATEQFEARHLAPDAVGAQPPAPAVPQGSTGREVDPTLPPDSTPPARDAESKPRSRRTALIVVAALLLLTGAAAVAFLLWRAKAGGDEPAAATFRANVTLEPRADGPAAVLGIVAPPGAQVRLNGELLETGSAAKSDAVRIRHTLDLSEEAAGEADEVELTDTTLAIEVTLPSGATSRAELPVRLPVTPLALHAPGPRWVLDRGTLLLSGTAAPGARIQSGAHLTRADAQRRFVLPILAPKVGVLTVTATGPDQIPRATQVQVLERATLPPPTPFSALPAKLGARVRVDGEVTEARQGPDGATLLLEVNRGCANAPCRIEVLHPMRLDPARLRAARTVGEGPSYGPGQDLTVVGDVLAAGPRPKLRAEALELR